MEYEFNDCNQVSQMVQTIDGNRRLIAITYDDGQVTSYRKAGVSDEGQETFFVRKREDTEPFLVLSEISPWQGVFMKLFRRIAILFLTIVASVSLGGCFFGIYVAMNAKEYSYEFEQPMDNVESVELRSYDYDTRSTSVLMVLEIEEAKKMLTELGALVCNKPFGDYNMHSYGDVVVYIVYSNGEGEVIGARSAASVDADGKWHPKRYSFKDEEVWRSIVRKYTDADLVPE